MMTHEQALLGILMEECDEVSQRASKAMRFGFAEVQPGQMLNNAERLWQELDDLAAMVHMLNRDHGLGYVPNKDAKFAKIGKVERFLELSRSLGRAE